MPIPHPVALEQDDWFELTVGLWIFQSALERLWDGFDYSYEKSVSYGKPEGPPMGCSPLKLMLNSGHLWNVMVLKGVAKSHRGIGRCAFVLLGLDYCDR